MLCLINDKLKDILNKVLIKSSIEKNSVTFLYSGNKINEELQLSEMIGKEDKNEIEIIILDKNEESSIYYM